jgi:hypothetical protein
VLTAGYLIKDKNTGADQWRMHEAHISLQHMGLPRVCDMLRGLESRHSRSTAICLFDHLLLPWRCGRLRRRDRRSDAGDRVSPSAQLVLIPHPLQQLPF